MKILIAFAIILLLAKEKKACKKNECLKGRVVTTKCMGTVIQITDGKFDASLVTAKWKDSLKTEAGESTPELNNVFRLANPCKLNLKEGDEILFTISTTEKDEPCATCMAFDLKPPTKKAAIVLCNESKTR
jgi:hypothetical protein